MKLSHESLKRLLGQPVAAIDTPAAVVDLDAMQRNLTRMAEFARKHDIRWRAHAKMHRCAAIARLQVQAGASGICVQKTSEAEIMAAGGVDDIFITNEVVDPGKLARVATLAHQLSARGGQLAIAVDHAQGVERLARAMDTARGAADAPAVIDVFVEIDVGHHRCGVAPGAPALALALQVRRHAALRFAGLQAYHGRAQHLRTPHERREAIAEVVRGVQATRAFMATQGLQPGRVTGAGTGTMVCEAASGEFHELQAGSFLFMDADYAANERDPAQPAFEHALFIKSQVMSVSASHAVCDAGHKSHALDSGLPRVHALAGSPALVFANAGDEHGILRPPAAGGPLPGLGDTVWLVPGHCDPTVNLHDHLIGVSGGLAKGVIQKILRVDARGASD